MFVAKFGVVAGLMVVFVGLFVADLGEVLHAIGLNE